MPSLFRESTDSLIHESLHACLCYAQCTELESCAPDGIYELQVNLYTYTPEQASKERVPG